MIRAATENDKYMVISRLGRDFYDSMYYSEFAEFCSQSMGILFDYIMNNGVMLVAESEGEVVGVIGLVFTAFLFNRSKTVASEVLWYVTPKAQSAGVGKMLMAEAEKVCKESGVHMIHMICLESSPPQAGQAYLKAGYALKEHSYMKVV